MLEVAQQGRVDGQLLQEGAAQAVPLAGRSRHEANHSNAQLELATLLLIGTHTAVPPDGLGQRIDCYAALRVASETVRAARPERVASPEPRRPLRRHGGSVPRWARGNGVLPRAHRRQAAEEVLERRSGGPEVPHYLRDRPALPLAVLVQGVLGLQPLRGELRKLILVRRVLRVQGQYMEEVARRHGGDVHVGGEDVLERQRLGRED
mmetsp:Transcript_126524/g.366272  ORF Transcript_126524/g.366272 Transcript_126524/m.366272 type:complete len:207 (-) Transcript_126524:946-1566(-)